VPLPGASRSLPRPSSPLCAQASPTCLPSLDYKQITVKQNYAHCFKRVTFSCENVFSYKDSSIPRSTIHPLSNSNDPRGPKAKGSTIESGRTECVETKRLRETFPPSEEGLLGSVKEVIQPQVPLRLPCYDFAPVTALAFGRLIPCGFRHGLRALTASMA
jgi:hypothetical protein